MTLKRFTSAVLQHQACQELCADLGRPVCIDDGRFQVLSKLSKAHLKQELERIALKNFVEWVRVRMHVYAKPV